MAGSGPALEENEAQEIIDFIIQRAKDLQTHDLTGLNSIDIDDFSPFFSSQVNSEHHRINRIRWKMGDILKENGIVAKLKGNNYEFTLDPSIEISENVIDKELKETVETQSNFKEKFIPPNWFKDLSNALKHGGTPVIVGPQGCGKSRIAEEAIARLGRKSLRIAMGEFRDPVDLIGTKEIVMDNGVSVTKFVPGILTFGLQEGYGVILDEIDTATPNMLCGLNKLFEIESQGLLQTEKGPVEFERHEDAVIIATANTWGFGDETGDFAGTQMQNRATWDRFHPKFDSDYDYEVEQQLVAQYLPKRVIDALYKKTTPNKMGIIRKIRDAINDPANELNDTLGLRSILFFARTWKIYGWHKGMYYFVNEFRPENRDAIEKMITDRFGNDLGPSRNDYDKNSPRYIPNLKSQLVSNGLL